jgi:hypothetical protein
VSFVRKQSELSPETTEVLVSTCRCPPIEGTRGDGALCFALQVRLLAYVSGLDRGISAFPRQQREVDTLAAALERSLDRAVSLSYDAIGSGMDKFRGAALTVQPPIANYFYPTPVP